MGVEVDLSAGYVPLPPQRAMHLYFTKHPHPGEEPDPHFDPNNKFALLSGGFRSGKTVAASRQCIKWAIEYPGCLGFIGRQKATELHDSTWRTYRRELEATGLIQAGIAKVRGGESKNNPAVVTFEPFKIGDRNYGGSTTVFRHFQSGGGLLGTEPDFFFLDEAGEIADEIIEMLIGRLSGSPTPEGLVWGKRSVGEREVETRVAGPLRGIFASNPGASSYLRRNFRPKGVKGSPAPRHKTFEVPTLNNPYLSQEYVDTILQRYPEGSTMRRAYIEGDWSAFEGQLITNFEESLHVVPDMDGGNLKGWTFVEGFDFGWRNPTAYVLAAYKEEGDEPIIVLDCYQRSEATAAVHVARINAIRAAHQVKDPISVGDPAGVNRGPSGTSWIDDFAYQGVYIAPLETARGISARDTRLINLLSKRIDTKDGEKPALVFCERVVDSLVHESMLLQRYVEVSGTSRDDPKDMRTKKDDHLHDALCYALMGTSIFLDDVEVVEPQKPPILRGANTVDMLKQYTVTDRQRWDRTAPGWDR